MRFDHWATPVPRRWGVMLTVLWYAQRRRYPRFAGRLYHAAWARAAR